MKTVKISLNSIDKEKAFVNEVTKPIDLNIHSENNIDEILAKLDEFIVK